MKFQEGSRVVGLQAPFEGEAGTVTYVMPKEFEGYGVLYDNPELRGPLGDGSLFMAEIELKEEER